MIERRCGKEFDTLSTWRLSLLRDFEQDVADPHQVRRIVRLYAEAAGARLPGGVSFTSDGFEAYLDALT